MFPILGPDADKHVGSFFMPVASSEEMDVLNDNVNGSNVNIDAMVVVMMMALVCKLPPQYHK